jgi:hypothetical protein
VHINLLLVEAVKKQRGHHDMTDQVKSALSGSKPERRKVSLKQFKASRQEIIWTNTTQKGHAVSNSHDVI